MSETNDVPMTPTECHELDQLEASIEAGLATFDRVSLALDQFAPRDVETFLRVGRDMLRLKRRKLYRLTRQTWMMYCLDHYTYTASTIDRRLDRFEVVESMWGGSGPNGRDFAALPNERQARELHRVAPDHRLGVWEEANARALAEGKPRPSAEDVRDLAKRAGLDPDKYGPQRAAPRPPADPRLRSVSKINAARRRLRFEVGRLDAGEQELLISWLDAAPAFLDEAPPLFLTG